MAKRPEANFRANVQPLLAVMEYVQRYDIGRTVYLSSNAVFRNAPATEIDETRPPQPLGVYAVAKTLMEQLVETMRQEYGRDLVCARLGAIYGPREFPRSTRPKLSLVAQMITAALTRGEIVVERPDAAAMDLRAGYRSGAARPIELR